MRICREFENWRALSGKFLRQKSCYPESFRFLRLWRRTWSMKSFSMTRTFSWNLKTLIYHSTVTCFILESTSSPDWWWSNTRAWTCLIKDAAQRKTTLSQTASRRLSRWRWAAFFTGIMRTWPCSFPSVPRLTSSSIQTFLSDHCLHCTVFVVPLVLRKAGQ